MTARARAIARAEDVPATYTKLAEHLYNLVTKEGERRNPDDKATSWVLLSSRVRFLWIRDAGDLWKGGESEHPHRWARDMMALEVKRLKALL
jgi:hypothetical protein